MDFKEAISQLNKKFPEGVEIPTLGQRSTFMVIVYNDLIKITNSKGTSFLADEQFWVKVIERMNLIEPINKFKGAMYTANQWTSGNPNTIFSPYIPALVRFLNIEKLNDLNQKELFIKKYNFEKIGYYRHKSLEVIDRVSEPHIKISERKSLVYALFVGDLCKYIGKTIQGYSRPLNYHKNQVMKSVKSGIENTINIDKNTTVEVYALTESLNINFMDLDLNIVEALEQALITKFDPEWNNFRQK